MPPTQISSTTMASSAFMNCQSPYLYPNDAPNSARLAGSPLNSNLNASAYCPTFPTSCAPAFTTMPYSNPQDYVAPASAAMPYTNPQYHDNDPQYYEQNSYCVTHQEERDDHAEETYQGQGGNKSGSFTDDDFKSFTDNFLE